MHSADCCNVQGERLHQPVRRIVRSILLGISATVAIAAIAPIAQAVDVNAIERQEVTLINHYRLGKGLGRLSIDWNLTRTAEWMGSDMTSNNYFDHTDSLGRDPFARLAAFGYPSNTWRGENLAAGNELAQATFDQWKNSPGHNENMLDPNYTVVGISRVYDENAEYGYYWTTEFGSKFTRGVPDPRIVAKYTVRQRRRVKHRWRACTKRKPGTASYKNHRCRYYLHAARQLGYR